MLQIENEAVVDIEVIMVILVTGEEVAIGEELLQENLVGVEGLDRNEDHLMMIYQIQHQVFDVIFT